MIKKLICWLFGCIREEEVWKGKIVRMMDGLNRYSPEYWDEKVYETVILKKCPRCGTNLGD